jgi:peptidoglycan/LPS O-acetylase OafA/YrhL
LSNGVRPSSSLATSSEGRLAYLDGLRGIAVLAVMAWHYTNWGYEKFLPYGTIYASIPVLDHGWVGVNIFFMISGFVILMTLERCRTFTEFMARRWSRLFPAMLLASLIVFSASQVIGEHMPHGRAEPVNLLPGLTFVIPTFWETVLGRRVYELDGVYWTLYVEMGFYVVYGLLFFRFGWQRGLVGLAVVWLVTITISRIATAAGIEWLATAAMPLQWIGAEYFGWFIAGALFFKTGHTGSRLFLSIALAAGFVSALTSDLWQPGDAVSRAYLVGCVGLFALIQRNAVVKNLLDTRWLLFVGSVSYPLYLLHNELGVGLIGATGTRLSSHLQPLLPFLMMGLMLIAAWAFARLYEPSVMRALRYLLLAREKTRPKKN